MTSIRIDCNERLVVSYSARDDTLYLLVPPGESLQAVLRAARFVVPGNVYEQLASTSGLELLRPLVSTVASSGGQLRIPMPLAGWLTVVAARLLPGPERARYSEEFESELAEIACAGGGRRAQLAYAARTVLGATWQLRAALRSPRRRGALQ
jgi:hypothetical protein